MEDRNVEQLKKMIGMKELFVVPSGNLQGDTVLASNEKGVLTVSQMLKEIMYIIKFIRQVFGKNERKYSVAIKFLQSVQLALMNKDVRKPTKEQMKIAADVMHEVADMHAQSEEVKERNEKIAIAIKWLIDVLEE